MRLMLERLEDRTVPSTFTVTSLSDTVGTYTSGTLRWAIQQANYEANPANSAQDSSTPVITFSVSGTIT